ncbi:flavin reductase family protein [Nocardia asiatica]|uniref:flavin reductase family protein n=1 Tax=Nocardia asiatica TaxID=209252 RepID=UPI0007C53E9C|nr:iron-sulfur cluster-binding domain-containing protein [Nocardia asiatica]
MAATGAEWSLAYLGRTAAGMAYTDELSMLGPIDVYARDRGPRVDLPTLLATPRIGTVVYCCGPETLLTAVEEYCVDWPHNTLHVERFAPKHFESGEDAAFEVECAQAGVTVTVVPGESILDALEASGVSVLSACRQGTCGTCETVVLDGEPEHRDSLLTVTEQEANDLMMTCCSRSPGSRLVLDLWSRVPPIDRAPAGRQRPAIGR